MKRKALLLTILVLVCVSTASGDTLILKDGRKFKGKIVKRTATNVSIRLENGAEMGFKMDQVAKIEIAKAAPKTAAASSGSNTISSDLRAEVQKLRSEVNEIKKTHAKLEKELAELTDLKNKFDTMTKTLKDVDKRASRLPPKRGDFAGSEDRSRFEFEDCKVERGGDELKIHGYIKNVGSSPGVWARIISELQDGNGNVVAKNDVNPTFTPSGSHETRDKSVLSPGERFEFDSYIPFGRWASSRGNNMGIGTDILPPSGKDPKTIADKVTLSPPGHRFRGMEVVLKLEIPPKDTMQRQ